MAVPSTSDQGVADWCYISSGTWSLMGVESPHPIVSDKVRELNFTNESGVAGTTRLLKNIAGLWLIQESRRIWEKEGTNYTWENLIDMSNESAPLVSLINPDHESVNAPVDMPEAIRAFCRSTGQPVPDSKGAVVRCALESLALRYRMVLGWLEELVGNRIETIHIVGGGTQNKLLCQMAADACNRRVVAGPIEATAIGNIMMQAVSLGVVSNIRQAREVIANSFEMAEYIPQNTSVWDEAFGRFEKLI